MLEEWMVTIMPIELWFFIVAVIYTYIGYRWGVRNQTEEIIETTIDSLINEGYLFVRRNDENDDVELVKIQEIVDKHR